MKYALLLCLTLVTASTTHSMQHQNKTKKMTQKSMHKNEEIHDLFKQGKHKEATKQLPSKMGLLVQYSQTTNDPQFKLWVEARAKAL